MNKQNDKNHSPSDVYDEVMRKNSEMIRNASKASRIPHTVYPSKPHYIGVEALQEH
ncbi:hypothetical protein NH395_08935 [Halomonas sp. Mc5H-6]|nr:hypothetical protein [Halomonas sp. Mc5H-6]